jgi:hypothetical protein
MHLVGDFGSMKIPDEVHVWPCRGFSLKNIMFNPRWIHKVGVRESPTRPFVNLIAGFRPERVSHKSPTKIPDEVRVWSRRGFSVQHIMFPARVGHDVL